MKNSDISMLRRTFQVIALTPPGPPDPTIAIAASRAGAIGILDLEWTNDVNAAKESINRMASYARNACGIKLNGQDDPFITHLTLVLPEAVDFVILTLCKPDKLKKYINAFHLHNLRVILEITSLEQALLGEKSGVDGLLAKGNEAAGFVGEKTSYILLQQICSQISLPVWIQGGVGLHSAAACYTAGAAGVVLDSQLLLTREASLPDVVKQSIGRMDGTETLCLDGSTVHFRIYNRRGIKSDPQHELIALAKTLEKNRDRKYKIFSGWNEHIRDHVSLNNEASAIWLLGQDAAFAARLAERYKTVGSICSAIRKSIDDHINTAKSLNILNKESSLATSHGTLYPIVQGPMANVSDNAAFISAVAEAGALPFAALSRMSGDKVHELLGDVSGLLGSRPWGVGILGFNESELFESQMKFIDAHSPSYAILAGGMPGQVAALEAKGLKTYVHMQSAEVMDMFIESGARRFIFEGRECGGHVGSRSSFVLWEDMIGKLLEVLIKSKEESRKYHILFAGGIHNAMSAAMVASMAAPLVELGARVGVVMGTAYLFSDEILETGAIVRKFQSNALRCAETDVIESGPGHAIRCCKTPFIEFFKNEKNRMRSAGVPADQISSELDRLIPGRLRIASKGLKRARAEVAGEGKPDIIAVNEKEQQAEGIYMVGQLASLRDRTFNIGDLHRNVADGSSDWLSLLSSGINHKKTGKQRPSDIAIIGMSCLLPKAGDVQTYWENILNKTNAVTEIPSHRWDWRLYYDEDKNAKDKIYSKWGGFMDDLVFDPTRFGMPPKSIESVDPMQLMALEVAWRTLVDAGYGEKEFDRELASVILGASGGTGDVGMQYGLRAELPRFQGDLPEEVAGRLPEWTEDTFAGILLNVIAGRIANRLNFGGLNFTTDAACASSLAAIYQGMTELVSGRSSLVIAGGVDTVQGPFGYLCFSKTHALSPQGNCCTFDTSADGIVISEGIAMVAMKRLEDAERDGDRIYAVIKGIGGSSDGKTKGLTAPLPAGQLRAMHRAYEEAGFGPDTVGLFEAHGTGTVAGDTAELESTTTLLREAGCKPHSAVIGSVKTIIGHTKATAGVAGLLKATRALYNQVLPPHSGVTEPNKVLQEPDSPLYLIDQAVPWLAAGDRPRRAACSAFGFGGTNFHVVLEEYTGECRQWLRTAVNQSWPAELLLWRGTDREDLKASLTNIQQELKKNADIELRDLAYNLARAYRPGGETLAVVAADPADLTVKIGLALSYLTGESSALAPGIYHSEGGELDGKVAVLFPGQGAQYTGMLRELALNFPVFSETLSEADALLSKCFAVRFGGNVRLSHFIYPRCTYSEKAKADASKALTSTDVAQPALGAIGAGLWRLMKFFGLKPDMAGGHSYGEFTALFAGNYIDFDTLMSLSEARGRFIVDAVRDAGSELGTMAAIKASREDVEKAISDLDEVVVANHNAPDQTVISGSVTSIKEAVSKLSQAGVLVSEIPVAAAFHSRFVRPAQSALADLIGNIVWRDSGIPVYSNTTGKPHSKDIQQVKRIMTEHLVRPVEFLSEIEAMYRNGAKVFIELGPKSILTRLVGRILEGRPHKAIAVDNNGGGVTGLLNTFGQLICAGVTLDVVKLFEGRGCLDGDPASLDRMKRHGPVPKHAWMLNGSRARRATEPVKQIGVRVEELNRVSTGRPRNGSPLSLKSQNSTIMKNTIVSRKYRKEESQMGDHKQPPIAGETAIMAEYFDMMRQFLETQERIITMYMGGAVNGRRTGSRPRRHIEPQTIYEETVKEGPQTSFRNDVKMQTESSAGVSAKQPRQAEPSAVPETVKKADAASDQPQKISAGNVNGETESIDREKMTDILLTIIEDKTGYPRDMVGLDQNLEADLGIDSIKRIEIVRALLKALPHYGQALGEDRGGLNTQPTINSMLDLLGELKVKGGTTVPFNQTGMGSEAYRASHPFRYVMKPRHESIDEFALKRLGQGHFIITQDTLGIAAELSDLLCACKCTVSIIEREVLKDENSLKQWCLSFENQVDTIAGIVHLAQIGSDWLQADAPIQAWRSQLMLNEKSLFILLHDLNGKLNDDAHILSASALGGLFNRNGNNASGLSLQSGAVGLLKSLQEESPKLRVKTVDIDSEQQIKAITASIMDELELAGGRLEIGYPDGKRTIFHTVDESLEDKDERLDSISDLVVLATGGLRGVTAELLRELALPGNTLLLTGRSSFPEDEPEYLKSLITPSDLRQYFISEVRNGQLHMTPAEIQHNVKSILAAREMRNNINDFRQRGAKVEYYSVNATDDDAMRQLLDSIYDQYAGINAVVHGAGVIEDKLLVDKTSDSWSRVVETKVLGLLLLQKYLHPESLRFFTVLSSVAGRYGNSGQSDYATANELMNRLCCQLSNNWGNKVRVKAFCWGPWGRLTFGHGMVTEETEAKFARRSIFLVSPETGSRHFKDELTHEGCHNIEIICGEGPWEQIEADIGRIENISDWKDK